ncbi:hypothetical protein AB0D67_00900 [Streptosporangium sp. NPDC048047]|uniref:hypothetical protein n=1 Tax=Streptosporangium sp. NPDC048047 TaxID=3155748 RepID=UPI003413158E
MTKCATWIRAPAGVWRTRPQSLRTMAAGSPPTGSLKTASVVTGVSGALAQTPPLAAVVSPVAILDGPVAGPGTAA